MMAFGPARGLVRAAEHRGVQRDPDGLGEPLLHLAPEVEVGVVHDRLGDGHDGGDLLGLER